MISERLSEENSFAPGIQAQGLTKRYRNTHVVDDLSFSARGGVVTGFLGPNGAGKSTTLRMLLGLARPTRGHITLGGIAVSDLPQPASTIGALLDARAVHPARTAYDHLLGFAYAAGLGKKRVEEMLEFVGLAQYADRRAGEFSLGMNQRLGIATALLGNPQVVVLDEPLNGLDPEGIRWMRRLMRTLADEGRTVLFSSHLMSEMELAADDVVIIAQGKLIAESPLQEFIDTHTSKAIRVRTRDREKLLNILTEAGVELQIQDDTSLIMTGTDMTTIGETAAANGIALEELSAIRESLEDVFLRLTQTATQNETISS
ncbi:ATP-binding cassette domain-containing protein [Saccharospirillum sp. HFRX-1]|uniref:ABC transporter ATP-binding protein n=1 Tax=unclassified Saccharospirillum TaxID=2633430 RepID=UPI0037121688